jgi:hypothetical protein
MRKTVTRPRIKTAELIRIPGNDRFGFLPVSLEESGIMDIPFLQRLSNSSVKRSERLSGTSLYRLVALRQFYILTDRCVKAGERGGIVSTFRSVLPECKAWVEYGGYCLDSFVLAGHSLITSGGVCCGIGYAADRCTIKGKVENADLSGYVSVGPDVVIEGGAFGVYDKMLTMAGVIKLDGKVRIRHCVNLTGTVTVFPAPDEEVTIQDNVDIYGANADIRGNVELSGGATFVGKMSLITHEGGVIFIDMGRFTGDTHIVAGTGRQVILSGTPSESSEYVDLWLSTGVVGRHLSDLKLAPDQIRQLIFTHNKGRTVITFLLCTRSGVEKSIGAFLFNNTESPNQGIYFSTSDILKDLLGDCKYGYDHSPDIVTPFYLRLKEEWGVD